ncbi:glycosyltransferase WbsX family protein [Clostridium intestinale]|uniref:Glycoside hydrolase family 99-like domain-containing protein n=1 Tax=Clostridium intestinale TaxID=36845 RepID=A0A7D6VZ69_9CLOT|nr:glycoside hydrolase family 99-like domain-containing protein [Clostridium intestinale]QLY79131.1 glycoside hydrolase family 99-like domain-containing protein [Clostridium intestinale]
MTKTKLIAFYLPQFHQIPENDKWWGEGFTEWVNTKKAVPLFKSQHQPKEPENENYYNLLDKNTQIWQSELAKKYGIYGFCYYHYWFNGKLLLEKPMENMLENKDIDTKFCISWANEPWTRSWDGKSKEILLDQNYGDRDDWENHINYLLKFFKDERYIKIGNRPILLIYRTSSIKNCEEMLELWNKRCKESGIGNIYLVETLNSFQKNGTLKNSDAYVEFEPMLTVRHYLPWYFQGYRYIKKLLKKVGIKALDRVSYDLVWQEAIYKERLYDKKTFFGAFVNWDNTARKKDNALILDDFSLEKFEKYLKEVVLESEKKDNEYIFINAWNEWAEGTYIEPDKKYGKGYLERIRKIIK